MFAIGPFLLGLTYSVTLLLSVMPTVLYILDYPSIWVYGKAESSQDRAISPKTT